MVPEQPPRLPFSPSTPSPRQPLVYLTSVDLLDFLVNGIVLFVAP